MNKINLSQLPPYRRCLAGSKHELADVSHLYYRAYSGMRKVKCLVSSDGKYYDTEVEVDITKDYLVEFGYCDFCGKIVKEGNKCCATEDELILGISTKEWYDKNDRYFVYGSKEYKEYNSGGYREEK